MTTNCTNIAEDTEMAECDGEKVVTMMDVLQEQEEFEEDANAVLGASDDKNCTYPQGYIKRQAVYACLTCCSEAKMDDSKRAGVCLACSLNCHENHELIELYTRRNFRCDCGNPKFDSHPCQFTPNKTDSNDDNQYNQNFIGLYCTCHRPYPDPEATNEDEMIQCTICEDWLHASHLEAMLPDSDQYAEMICKMCMEMNEFLHDYSHLAVNIDPVIDDTNVGIITINETAASEVNVNDKCGKVPDESIELSTPKLNIVNELCSDTVLAECDNNEMIDKKRCCNTKDVEKVQNILSNNTDINENGLKLNGDTEDKETSEKEFTANTDDILKTVEAVSNEETNEIEKEMDFDELAVLKNDSLLTSQDIERSMEVEQQGSEQIVTNNIHEKETESITNANCVDAIEFTKDLDVNEDEKITTGICKNESSENKDEMELSKVEEHETLTMSEIETNNSLEISEVSKENMKLKNLLDTETQAKIENQSLEKIEVDTSKDSVDQTDTLEQATKELLELTSDMVEEDLPLEDKGESTIEKELSGIEEDIEPDKNVKGDIEECNIERADGNDSLDAEKVIVKETKIEEFEENLLLDGKDTNTSTIELNVSEESSKTNNTVEPNVNDVVDTEMANVESKNENDIISKDTSVEKIEQNILIDVKDKTKCSDTELNESKELPTKHDSVELNRNDTVDTEMDNVEAKNENDILGIEKHISKDTTIDRSDKDLSNGAVRTEEKELNTSVELSNTYSNLVPDNNESVDTGMDNIGTGELDNSNNTIITENNTDTIPKIENEHKRKLNDTNEMEVKKPRLEDKCSRPKGVKRVYKGATFWPSDFRQKLCTCNECLAMYKDLRLLFLLDPEDTVTAYENLGKQNIDGEPTQYEKGLQALSSLDRIQQINAVTEYNSMRDKLLDFLKSFKDRNEIVKEEDIRAFFAGMKPRREPDGVYFCR